MTTAAVNVLFPMDGESFADFMQRQAPEGWTIHQAPGICRYEITTDDGRKAIVDRSGISKGWTVKVLDTGIAYEFTVTTPDGREIFFHDCWCP
jgi:hypothetical protein